MILLPACRPGFETVVAYHRKNERWSEEAIARVFSLIPESCTTRADFIWILDDQRQSRAAAFTSLHKIHVHVPWLCCKSSSFLSDSCLIAARSCFVDSLSSGRTPHRGGRLPRAQRPRPRELRRSHGSRSLGVALYAGVQSALRYIWTLCDHTAIWRLEAVLHTDARRRVHALVHPGD